MLGLLVLLDVARKPEDLLAMAPRELAADGHEAGRILLLDPLARRTRRAVRVGGRRAPRPTTFAVRRLAARADARFGQLVSSGIDGLVVLELHTVGAGCRRGGMGLGSLSQGGSLPLSVARKENTLPRAFRKPTYVRSPVAASLARVRCGSNRGAGSWKLGANYRHIGGAGRVAVSTEFGTAR